MISAIFNEIFYRPLLNALVWLTGFLPNHDFGLAVIILTVAVRLVLFPLLHKSAKTQNKMKQIEPELKKIKNDFKNREEQARRTMELYRAHGVNPLSGVFLIFLQLPILIALYFVFRESPQANIEFLYSFILMPEKIDMMFLGLFDLGQGSVILAILAAASQFLQIKLMQPPVQKQDKTQAPDFAKMFSKQMTYFMPVLIFFIATRFPSAVALYWTVSNIFATVHEGIVRNKAKKIFYAERISGENSKPDTRHS